MPRSQNTIDPYVASGLQRVPARREASLARCILALLLTAVYFPSLSAAADEPKPLPVKFDLEALASVPEVYPTTDYAAEAVRAFFYEGQPYHGKPTRVFAYYGAPRAVAGTKLPAMVLIHGGGGTAFDRWVRVWTARGYAAIAMDLCGCVPDGSYGNWKRHEIGGPPGWDASFGQVDEPVAEHWQWHAVSAVLRAHSLIRSFPEVDADRIGVTGISWGGYLTGLVAGIDRRFKFASPVYGCGFLGENSAWLPAFEKMGAEKSARWLELWDPLHYLPHAKMPVLWVNGTNDFAYPMDSWKKSYRLPRSRQTLCLRVRMPHGHGPAGENPEEIHVYANAILKGAPPLARITGQGRVDKDVVVTFKSESPIARAELNFTRDSGKWQDRKWESVAIEVDKAGQKATGRIPEGTTVYFVNVFDDRNCAVSSEHEVLPAD
ncbi:MAG: acetylxylan esterase [Planctomycetia bacterium]|nr:acetylxylan esterase [Planctomycetia bacterium]